jgi:hypothetical protein
MFFSILKYQSGSKTKINLFNNCLDFNHRQEQCKELQKCLISSENHDFKKCPNKNKPKCANCQLPHAAVSKDCLVIKEKTTQKQQSNINKIFARANQNWSVSDVTKRNLNNRNESTQSLDTNNLLLQIIQLLNKVLMPPGAPVNTRTHTQR